MNSSNTQYKLVYIIVIISILFFTGSQLAFAEVWVPTEEFSSYFDSNNHFTVFGAIKNSENVTVIPTITIHIEEEDQKISRSFELVKILPQKEIPFKVKFPDINFINPILKNPEVSFVRIFDSSSQNIEVIYDETLIKHKDGHLTGRIINSGNETAFNVKVFAIIHGKDKVLDMAQNIEAIGKLLPGQIKEFSMYPDPSIQEEIGHYSCFAPTDSTVIPVTTKKNGEKFDFRYDSGSWYAYANFNEEGTVLSMRTQNSYPIETYANFEFYPISGKEKFEVFLNEKPIDFIQSIDEMGNWHVAFTVKPYDSGDLVITGFEKGLPPKKQLIPEWLKDNASWWAEDKISDVEFLENIQFLIQKGVIFVPSTELQSPENAKIPSWVKNNANWWSEDLISEEEFIGAIQFLINKGIIIA